MLQQGKFFPGQPYYAVHPLYFNLAENPDAKREYEGVRDKWPSYSGKIISHHGLNLGWLGFWSIWLGGWMLQMDHDATWMLGLAPFFADIGYDLSLSSTLPDAMR